MDNETLFDYLQSSQWDGLLNAELLTEICQMQSKYYAWNWEMPTMGGKIFWSTFPNSIDGWNIQRHSVLGYCRILDPKNVRRAYGSESSIKFLFKNWLNMRKNHKNGRYGLVLAGGGGKGAFEIGVWKYLRERGLDSMVGGISGTSVGALNGLLFLNGSYELAEEIWSQIVQKDMTPSDAILANIIRRLPVGFLGETVLPKVAGGMAISSMRQAIPTAIPRIIGRSAFRVALGGAAPPFGIALGAASLASAATGIIGKTKPEPSKTSSGITSQWRLEQLIDKKICWEQVENTKKISFCTISTKSLPHEAELKQLMDVLKIFSQKEYVCLSGLTREQIKNFVLASAALPLVYGARKTEGHSCLDGGIQDNIPIRPLVDGGFTELIVVHLKTIHGDCSSWNDSTKGLDLQGIRIHHVYPDDAQYDSWPATFTVSPKANQERIQQGYRAAQKWLADIPCEQLITT